MRGLCKQIRNSSKRGNWQITTLFHLSSFTAPFTNQPSRPSEHRKEEEAQAPPSHIHSQLIISLIHKPPLQRPKREQRNSFGPSSFKAAYGRPLN
ncbi:hypothetical protein PGT21_012817 [Puccinia graminis f. sp. tritici]|uniref:Uncharacterized protein n=1 Tax=Puccinia graminis f. sp. tritici TaxID=56615 RepID=A0A5B0M8F6_PUCGR|nr:hypothetical protein PGT21_012817 [Puccinia graminis f. sp. tritici]